MIKICLLGDPHGSTASIRRHTQRIKEAEFILCTGDIGRANKIRKIAFAKKGSKTPTLAQRKAAEDEIINTANAYLKALTKVAKNKTILMVMGNVENFVPARLRRIKKIVKKYPTVKIADYKIVRIKGLRIAGVPFFTDISWSRTFYPKSEELKKISAKETARVERVLSKKQYDILLSHIPPYGVLDRVNSSFVPKNWLGKNAGSKAIRKAIIRSKPKFVVCGHMHENPGAQKIGSTIIINLGEAGGSLISIPQ